MQLPRGARLIAFFVHGVPATAGSKRAFVYTPKGGGKPRAVVVDDNDRERTTRAWRTDVQAACREVFAPLGSPPVLLGGALRVRLLFVLPRPATTSAKCRPYPIVRPDVDKLSRAVLDALKNVVWKDDAQVVTKIATKRYQDARNPELTHVGAHVRIETEPLPGHDQAHALSIVNVPAYVPPGTSAAGTLPGLR